MSHYKSAIVGCGGRAYWHARAYPFVSQGQLVACCDRHPERRDKFAQEFGIRGYADVAEMVCQEKPDLVHLVTLPQTRVELMTLMDELGVPACLVEKPIAYEARDWKALVALESQSKTKFGVGAQFRYHPDLTRCRAALQSGKLGKLRLLDCSAVGTICDQGVHVIDWAMSLNEDARVTRVFGAASGVADMQHPRHPSPSTTVAQLVFANGVYALWNLGYSAPRVLDDQAYWKHCRVAAYAERGHTLYEEFGQWEIVGPDGVEQGHVADMDVWTAGNHQAQANLTDAMFAWLADDAKPVGTNLKRALDQWNAVLGLYASTLWRKPVDLPFDPPDDLWAELTQILAS
ncbi:MAG: Gfo/Idh/MocA family oxidoreductase [Caldilineaceae bacterium]